MIQPRELVALQRKGACRNQELPRGLGFVVRQRASKRGREGLRAIPSHFSNNRQEYLRSNGLWISVENRKACLLPR